jgi:hypothetical protein
VKVKVCETRILPFLLYEPETWSLILTEEHRVTVFENMILRRICEQMSHEVLGECRKLDSDEIYNVYSSPNIITQIKSRRMSWAGHVARTGNERNCGGFLVGNVEGKRPIRRGRVDGMMD